MTLILTFDPSGQGRCLYSELFDLARVGPLQVRRASNIEFNHRKQLWEVKNLKGRVRFFSRHRTTCLAWEQQNLTP